MAENHFDDEGDFSSQLTKMFSFVQTTKENQISIVGSNRSVIDITLCYGYGGKKSAICQPDCLHEKFVCITEAEEQVKHNFIFSLFIPVYVRMNNTV